MTARIHYLTPTTQRQRADLLLGIAAHHMALLADLSDQAPDRLRAELLACIAANDLAGAVAVLAGLSRYTNERSA